MSVRSLSNVDPATANSALAVTLMSIGGPGVDHVPPEFSALSKAVIEEARAQLGLDPADQSRDAHQKIKRFLSQEVDRRLFEGVDRGALRHQMGNKGQLPLSGYKIESTQVFKTSFRGENLDFAKECVRLPDLYEHFLKDDSEVRPFHFSVFARKIKSLNRKKSYWSLVSAVRDGDILKITTFWRVFPETVRVESAERPLDILRSFLVTYGVNLIVDGVPTNETMIVDRLIRPNNSVGEVLNVPNVGDALEAFEGQESAGVRIGLGYGVAMNRYKADRAKFA